MLDWVLTTSAAPRVQLAVQHWRLAAGLPDPVLRLESLAKAFEVLALAAPDARNMNADVARQRLLNAVPALFDDETVAALLATEPRIRDTDHRTPHRPEWRHSEAIHEYDRWCNSRPPRRTENISKALERLLWVVRSNSVHGHKLAVRNSTDPAARDQLIAGRAADVLERCIALVLGPLDRAAQLPKPPSPETRTRLP